VSIFKETLRPTRIPDIENANTKSRMSEEKGYSTEEKLHGFKKNIEGSH
jgi:hypothetical protein